MLVGELLMLLKLLVGWLGRYVGGLVGGLALEVIELEPATFSPVVGCCNPHIVPMAVRRFARLRHRTSEIYHV